MSLRFLAILPKIRYLADASREIKEAAAYYETISPQLGQRFRLTVRDGVRRIAGHAHWWPKVGERARRYLLTGWPYAIYYVEDGDELVVVAIGHQHRRPEYWRERLG